MRFLVFLAILSTLPTPVSAAKPYCVGIRGNGENVAAHWAALAHTVEDNGLPAKLAGGSSATVTMFFVDSIAGNPAVKEEKNEALKRKKAGLMIKSLGEFVSEMARNEQAMSAYQFMNEMARGDSSLVLKLKKVIEAGRAKSPTDLQDDLTKAVNRYFPLLNPEMVRGLMQNPRYFSKEAKKAVDVFGKFDAVNDDKLFFRPGVIDFKEFALNLGNIADFYEGNTDEATKRAFNQYLTDCAEKTHGQEWGVSDAACKKQFQGIVKSYMAKGDFQNKALFKKVGTNIESIPSTTLVTGNAVDRFNKVKRRYDNGEEQDYKDFFADPSTKKDGSSELRFGYWTNKGAEIDLKLKPLKDAGDLKSIKFMPMKANNWFEVLATSPAEPGLASIQPIPVNTTREQVLNERAKSVFERWNGLEYKKDAFSAGGWADLHPIPVLEAAGCPTDNTHYLNRKGCETVFGQQTMVKLSGTQKEVPDWTRLGEKNDEGWPVTTEQAKSAWNQLYNCANYDSSINRSLRMADAVYCTDWNGYEVFKGEMPAMMAQAYKSPVFLKPGVAKSFQVNPTPSPDPKLFPGCVAKEKRSVERTTERTSSTSAE